MQREQIHNIGRRRAWLIWVVSLAVYLLAVFHRSSLGVAGLLAADRFGVNGTQLAFFTVLQLVVYAGLQVPIGVLLDRYGSRALLLVGLTTMTVGQVGFAFVTDFTGAVLARVLLGAGDAMIFVSVIRLVSMWFLVRQAPMVTQITGWVGQFGAIIAAGPFAWALHQFGWTTAFAWASAVGVPLMVLTALLVKDSPYRRGEVVRVKMRAVARSLAWVWGNPGTRLGLWSHFTSQFSVTVFSMIWGFPFLVAGQGLTPTVASALLMVMTGWVVVSGLVLGHLVSRFPFYRSWIVLSVVALIALAWTSVLVLPGPAPMWHLVLLVCATATGGPASMVGFDLARSFTPMEVAGRANGIVNVGGFSASLLTMALIGVVLDLREPRGTTFYDLADFRVAMCVQYLFWALGAVQMVRYRRKAVAHLRRMHPGAVEKLKRGEPFVHPGFADTEGL